MKEQNRTTFVLSGFSHDVGFRVFEFDCVQDGKTRTHHTVRADMTLVRKHGIHVQELPLLCRKVLDDCQERDRTGSMVLSEAEMIVCAQREAARHDAAKKRRFWKRPSTEETNTDPAQPPGADRSDFRPASSPENRRDR